MLNGESDMKQRLLQEIIKLFETMPDQDEAEKAEPLATEALAVPEKKETI